LDRYGQEHGWKVYLWGKAACPFNDVPLWLTAYKGDYKACRQWRATVYTAMQSLPRVDIAIMSRSRSYMGMVIQDDGQKTSADTVNPYWRAGTQRTLSHLSTIARQVVLLHATPVASSDIPACLSEHADDPQSCDFPRDAGTQDILLKPERQAAAASGAAFVDVTSAICPTDPCPVLTPAGRIIYRDVHHLTASFARSLADVLGTAIVRARPPLT
jgi:hypothetical protein